MQREDGVLPWQPRVNQDTKIPKVARLLYRMVLTLKRLGEVCLLVGGEWLLQSKVTRLGAFAKDSFTPKTVMHDCVTEFEKLHEHQRVALGKALQA
jgi:hypothetical protein